MYGQRKLMSLRTPVVRDPPRSDGVEACANGLASPCVAETETPRSGHRPLNEWVDELAPSSTEVETATDTDVLTETETEYESHHDIPTFRGSRQLSPSPKSSTRPLPSKSLRGRTRKQSYSPHDLLTRFFRKDPIGLYNIDLLRFVAQHPTPQLEGHLYMFLRAGDAKLVLLTFYAVGSAIIPSLFPTSTLALHFAHALIWRIFHSFGLGALLRSQSERKTYVKHFIKHYVYHRGDVKQAALEEAFSNWKGMYNLSLCMTYGQ